MIKNQLDIFYVDDDAEDLKLFKEAIEGMEGPFNVYTQNDADGLLVRLKNRMVLDCIVFLDLRMLNKNGLDILKELRVITEKSEIPIIILSGSDDVHDIEKAKEYGANFFILKPTSYRTFKKALAYALSINWKDFNANRQNFVYTE